MSFVRVINGCRYYYKSVRENGKVRSVYLGRAGRLESKNAEDMDR